MQGILRRRVFSGRISLSSQRCFSQLAQKNASLQENDVTVPKMPPFDYSPPPYNGPTVDEIMAKRKAYLSPSLFHLYKKPVSHSPHLIISPPLYLLFLKNHAFYCFTF